MGEGHRERLRKTYMENGLDAFHDHQVLELILTYALPRVDTNPIAHRLLKRYGSLRAVFEAKTEDLMTVDGIGEKAAVLLKLMGDTARRSAKSDARRCRINNSLDAMELAMTLFDEQRYESVYLISLNNAREVIHIDKVSSGTVANAALYTRIIVECALRHGAKSAILVHNHPSGDLTPSVQDIEATDAVAKALSAIETVLDDHIIVSRDDAYSCIRESFLNHKREIEKLKRLGEA